MQLARDCKGQIRLPADSSHRRSHSATLPIGVIPKPTFPTIGSYDGSVRGPYLGEALGSSPRLLKACGVLALLSVATGKEAVAAAKEVTRMIASMIKRSPLVLALIMAVGAIGSSSPC